MSDGNGPRVVAGHGDEKSHFSSRVKVLLMLGFRTPQQRVRYRDTDLTSGTTGKDRKGRIRSRGGLTGSHADSAARKLEEIVLPKSSN